jgi:hypothetical protein
MTSSAATCVRHAAAPLKILSQCTASQVTQHARRSLALTVAAHCCFAVPHGPCFGIPFQIGVGEGIMRLMVNDFRCMLPLLNSLLNTLPNSVLSSPSTPLLMPSSSMPLFLTFLVTVLCLGQPSQHICRGMQAVHSGLPEGR